MGYLVKNMRVGQAILITVDAGADMEELERRMQADGINISVVSCEHMKARISTRAPSGITPVKTEDADLGGCLALGRAAGEQIVITIRPGAVPHDVMSSFARVGVVVGLAKSTAKTAGLRVKASTGLLVLRDELIE